MSEVRKLEAIPIDWESTGYSVLKDLEASVLGIFCEFIDNSIQSYRDDSDAIKLKEPNYQLKIDLIKTGTEIIIKDNAGGIDTDSFERAMKPANRPKNNKGLNEFGIGMKYAAVWISNEWVLKSKSYKEKVLRTVTFNYEDVVNNNLKSLVPEEVITDDNSHGTEIILRKLEKERTARWQEKYLKTKIASIYRNFIRSGGPFYNYFTEEPIEIRYNGELLVFKEYNFLKAPYYYDYKILLNENASEIEWKWKFPWRKISVEDEELNYETGELIKLNRIIEVSGFVGILPNGDQKAKNGFTLFRRGRMIEGAENRVYPVSISTQSSRSYRYIKLYGEIHFRNVAVSFNKTRLTINSETRNEIFSVLAGEIRRINIDGKIYDMLKQAQEYRVGFKHVNAKNAIENLKREYDENIEDLSLFEKKKEIAEIISKTVIDESYDEQINLKYAKDNISVIEEWKNIEEFTIGPYSYKLKTKYLGTGAMEALYTFGITEDHEERTINLGINLKHQIFHDHPEYFEENSKLKLITEFIKCLAKSEAKSLNGLNSAKSVRHAFNLYATTLNL